MYIIESEMKFFATYWKKKKNSCTHTKVTKFPVFIVSLVSNSAVDLK